MHSYVCGIMEHNKMTTIWRIHIGEEGTKAGEVSSYQTWGGGCAQEYGFCSVLREQNEAMGTLNIFGQYL